MKYSGQRKLLCESSKLSKFNAFNLLGYQMNTDASIRVYKFRPDRTGFKMYAKYTQLQLTFLALHTLQPVIDGGDILRTQLREFCDLTMGKRNLTELHFKIKKHDKILIIVAGLML